MHLIVVDRRLKNFDHIHPEFKDDHFEITTKFPADGVYHLYINFKAVGGLEQQFAFEIPVGSKEAEKASQPVDTSLTKTFGDYQVTLETTDLNAGKLSIGQQTIKFNLKDAKTNNPVGNLKPFLAAFGHLTMINEQTYDYVHVHPSNQNPPSPTDSSGPDVDFLPLGLYGPIKPGIYRLFAQFNPDGKLFTADFTVNIK